MDELMSIGEFAERSGLSPKRLRTYAAEGLLVPAAVDSTSGYRYYSPGQLRDARVIDTLRQAGMPLADIRPVLRQPSAAPLDAWARRVEVDAAQRRRALDAARGLLAVGTERPPSIPDERAEEEMPMTELKTAARTETGRTRDNNEDVTVSSARLAVVADGMGGLPGGEMAAGIAAGLIETTFTGRSLDELEAAVRAANWAIWDRAAATPGLEAMGTTVCVAGLLDDGRLAVANVGDSRAYLWHHDTLRQLTQDHSVTAELVHRGELDEEDVAHHPHRGWLTRALGVGPEVEVDGATHPIEPGDRLLVCTDGLVNELSDDEIAKVMATEEDLTAAVERLVGLVTSREAPDDVSVVLAEVSA